MQLFVEQVLNGVANGVVYGSVALALVLIFRTTGVLNFAQGEMALFATFISWKLTQQGLPVVGAIAPRAESSAPAPRRRAGASSAESGFPRTRPAEFRARLVVAGQARC
jgi:hypothetical protein